MQTQRQIVGNDTICSYCHSQAICQVDLNDETRTPYCQRCWMEWDAWVARGQPEQPARMMISQHDQHVQIQADNRAAELRGTGSRHDMVAFRRNLFDILVNNPAGVLLSHIPHLMFPLLHQEGNSWSSLEFRKLCQSTVDFTNEEDRLVEGSSERLKVLMLAEHIRVHIEEQLRNGLPPHQPQPQPARILLILDLNHLLCERQSHYARATEESLRSHRHKYVKPGRSLVWERPHATTFVEWCMARFTVALWSSGKKKNIEPIVRELFTAELRRHFVFVWGQEECTVDHGTLVPCNGSHDSSHEKDASTHMKPLIRKELMRVWRKWTAWDHTCTVLVDDDPLKCSQNAPHTALHPHKWFALQEQSLHDELAPDGPLRLYLNALSHSADTQSFIRQQPYYTPGTCL